MAKFKMVEPPAGSVILDMSGNAWQHVGIGWVIAGSDMSWAYNWKEMQAELSQDISALFNVTPEWAKAAKYAGTPRILYVPGEELICECGEED